MAKLIFETNKEEAVIADDSSILDACEAAGVPFACSEGVCGTCAIEITKGMDNLSEFTQAEADFFGDHGNERLACQCNIKHGSVTIKF